MPSQSEMAELARWLRSIFSPSKRWYPAGALSPWEIEELSAVTLPSADRMRRKRELAERYGVSVRTIERYLERFG